jgi:hypothetical protein
MRGILKRTKAPKFEVVKPIINANKTENIMQKRRIGSLNIILKVPIIFVLKSI